MVRELGGEQLMKAFTSMAQRLSNLNQVLIDRAVTLTEYNAGPLCCNLPGTADVGRLVTLTAKNIRRHRQCVCTRTALLFDLADLHPTNIDTTYCIRIRIEYRVRPAQDRRALGNERDVDLPSLLQPCKQSDSLSIPGEYFGR